MASILLAGCGGTSADDLAKQACEKTPPTAVTAVPGPAQNDSLRDLVKARREISASANLAGRAAKADASWRDLANSYSPYLDVANFLISFKGDTSHLSMAQREQANKLFARLDGAGATMRAECRLATA